MKQTMLSLEARDLESAIEKYLEYVGSAWLDRSEPIEDDAQAQGELASDLSEAFDDTVHSHSDKIKSSRRWTSPPRARSRKAQR
jgi:hypothetical protein